MFHSWFVVKLQKTTIVLLLYEALFYIQAYAEYIIYTSTGLL